MQEKSSLLIAILSGAASLSLSRPSMGRVGQRHGSFSLPYLDSSTRFIGYD